MKSFRYILIVLLGLACNLAHTAVNTEFEEMMDRQLRKGAPLSTPRPPSFANSSEVIAADNALRNMCIGFDQIDAQNIFLPPPMHHELFALHKRAVARDPQAQAEIADRYVDGRTLPKDFKTAICWYRAAAQNGSSYAELWLALFYQHGWVVKESASVSAHWFTLAFRHHNIAAAERQVADRYADDDSGVYDMGKALVWYQRAAEKRDLGAELALGNFYATSHTPSDIRLALNWYGKASAQHSVAADYNIGQIYYRGVGIPQDLKEAHKWLLRAAERGYKPAQYDLAEMYYKGIGVKLDWIKAYAWLEVSNAAENNPAAQDLEDMLITHFNPTQLTQASHLAREYKARFAR